MLENLLKILMNGWSAKAKVDEKAQHTGVCEHFESTFNTVIRHSVRSWTGSERNQTVTRVYPVFTRHSKNAYLLFSVVTGGARIDTSHIQKFPVSV